MNLRRALHDLPTVGAKVTWIVALISGASVLALSLSTGLRGYDYLRQQMIQTVTAQSLIVAMNSSAPLSFGDDEMAEVALSALRVVEGVQGATLVDADNRVFARFAPPGSGAPGSRLFPVGHWRNPDADGYVLVVPVGDQTGRHGRLQVNYSGAGLVREALTLGLQSVLLSLAAILLAWWLARRLHPVLTEPVVELERVTRRVRDTGDYALRARRTSNDELGRLTEDFNEMLEQIESSRRELVQARQRAEESSRLKDEFVATLSHELRTPLSPIVAWIQMLRMPQGAAELPAGLDVMDRNAKALIRIIDDLLDMSRIVAGTLRLDVQAIDLGAIVRGAAETLAPAAQSRRLQLDLERVAPVPPLLGDPARLQQVVWNLLSNAIKFSPPGARVSVSTCHNEACAGIVVADNGIGIEPAFLPFAFDRFRQQDGSITRNHGGLGLGLSIVRQLVELHGGTVAVDSPGPGLGSTFTVWLPLADAGAASAAGDASARPAAGSAPMPPGPTGSSGRDGVSRGAARIDAAPSGRAMADGAAGPPPAPRLQGLVVLVVEDEPDMRGVIRRTLQDAGAVVLEAVDAAQALECMDARRPDVLVSDIGLPDQDGYELLRQLRRGGGAAAAVPAIALTAYAHPEERLRALAAGYQRHLSKPVAPAALLAAVAAVAAAAKDTASAATPPHTRA